MDSPNKANVQGMIYRAYSHPYSVHMLFQFPDGCQPSKMIHPLLQQKKVQSAEDWGDAKPRNFVNIGFTYSGVVFLKLPNVNPEYFPIEFRLGPTNYYSQQSLYDIGPSAPSLWTFGSTGKNRVDMVVHAYALDQAALDEIMAELLSLAAAAGVQEFLPLAHAPHRYYGNPDLGPFIQFGYRDGIDQPNLNWPNPWPTTQKEDTPPDAANNFIIGYPNSALIPGPQDTPDGTGAWARDGFFNALRVFFQDVHAFEQFLIQNAPLVQQRMDISENAAKEWLAAKLNGRWRDGSPLELAPNAPNPELATATQFNYTDDMKGLRCPFSAHTRVANPRNQPIFIETEDPLPRIVRRGVPYGAVPQPPDLKGEQGLIGIFLCGSISQQFEKIYGWMNGNNMSPVFKYRAQDPLLGNRGVPGTANRYKIPMPDGNNLVLDLTDFQFTVTRGTAYCFLPSLAALQTIATS